MRNKRLPNHVLIALFSVGMAWLVGCGEDEDDYMSWSKEVASANGGRSGNVDVCQAQGWYDDGVCDAFCPGPDDDCHIPADMCIANEECGEGQHCDLSDCLSCCPGAPSDASCIAACCGVCREDSAVYDPCTNDRQCDVAAGEVCDLSECLSCCPDAAEDDPCIAACCGQCVQPPVDACDSHADCVEGEEWCVDGRCVPCDNSGEVCDLYCPHGFVPPINGCQPCRCQPSYVPCMNDGDCATADRVNPLVCDRSECLSCCPDAGPGDPCIDACCGQCVELEEPDPCSSHDDCAFGLEWCVDGKCVPCDDTGDVCDLYCPHGFVPPINGCQPCECQPGYRPCTNDEQCQITAVDDTWVCDMSECLSCCPDAAPGDPCIALCCGQCVEVSDPDECEEHADCDFGAEWCIDGRCVPCDNSGLLCTIACLLVPPINGCQPCQCAAGYEPCMSDGDCVETATDVDQRVCDRSLCLSCCPDALPGTPCIDACCGRCIDAPDPEPCTSHDQCPAGEEWCVDGRCVPCDNSGAYCDLYCPFGMVDPINGCQPCRCKPRYRPCMNDGQCAELSAESAEASQVCDMSECLSCCPDAPPGTACIAACCGRCVDSTDDTCTRHEDCEAGEEWCIDGECAPCDNSGLACTIPCELVPPINGCQPCQCASDYVPCMSLDQCPLAATACDMSECLYCCPNAPAGTACITVCCGACVFP